MSDQILVLGSNGLPQQVATVSVSAGAGDGNKIARLDGTGKFDSSVLPANSFVSPLSVVASEALAAGDMVEVYFDGTASAVRVRRANGATGAPGRPARGFVTAAVANAATAIVYFQGIVTLAGLTPGVSYFLSATTAGAVTATPPSGAGQLVQKVGFSISATQLVFESQIICFRA